MIIIFFLTPIVKKRYNSGSKRGSPYQVNQNLTPPQQSSYEDSLTAECLIRGNMEDQIFKTLFIGESQPRQNETVQDLMIRRLKDCCTEKKDRYGIKELLKIKMKEVGINTEANGRWVKYSIMGAPFDNNSEDLSKLAGEEKQF
ncbi:unnamed protein product [Paramecium octaurelia]|uniref:Uncharacterized protein n=1 Tax=Paramecium octaurelia TaxID=43137 RepID=A0A8S1TIV6_PAROT|nr:unnamed protein product [Paramecium octaurelia]